MKRNFSLYFVTILLILAFSVSCNNGAGFECRKSMNGVTVTMSSEGRQLTSKNKNKLKITMTDSSGKSITEVPLNIRYFSKHSPGRPSYDVSSPAMPKGDGYEAIAEFPANGEWIFEIHTMPHDAEDISIDLVFPLQVS